MPKPYHTPKSERDEKVGAITEAEETFDNEMLYGIPESFAPHRFSGTFYDVENEETHLEIIVPGRAEAIERFTEETNRQVRDGSAFPWIGQIAAIQAYDFTAQEWFSIPVPLIETRED